MDYNLQVGMTNEIEYVVSKNDATAHFGGDFPVFSTPKMIDWMEQVSLKLCQQVLPKGMDTVGTFVDVKHMAATPVGMKVRVIAEIIELNGKMLTLKVKAYDEKTKIGEGTHGRAIIDVEKFISRLKEANK
ncbi:MAG: thioesterase family protein [Lachnospiraceae bacterium]|nr:thioesterase family protein [Lachnospiraceae bacterium]